MIFHDDDDDECKGKEGELKSEGIISKLLKTRIVMVNGTVNQEMAERVMAQVLVLDAESKEEPIRVVITSPGGHVDSGYAIHDVLKFVDAPIFTLGAGWVASIAVPIFLGGDPGKRFSLPNTRFLLHQPSGGAGGQAADIRIEAQEILKIRKRINELLATETGQPYEKVSKDSDRNFWMNAEEAVEYGLVNKIVTDSKGIV
jgi:ATP-dependent Clp protease, protease subunit